MYKEHAIDLPELVLEEVGVAVVVDEPILIIVVPGGEVEEPLLDMDVPDVVVVTVEVTLFKEEPNEPDVEVEPAELEPVMEVPADVTVVEEPMLVIDEPKGVVVTNEALGRVLDDGLAFVDFAAVVDPHKPQY
jgi:hypothetical protein